MTDKTAKPIYASFCQSNHDRLGVQRTDSHWVKQALEAATSRFVIFANGSPIIDMAGENYKIAWYLHNEWHRHSEMAGFNPLVEPVLLGQSPDGAALFGIEISYNEDDEQNWPEGHKAIDLRSIAMQGLLAGPELGLLAQARSVLNWHINHGFCAKCGQPTITADAGHRRDCPHCMAQHFPRTDPVAIVAVTHGDKMLLGRSAHFMPNVYSTLAGFIEPGETMEDAARREIHEEAGIQLGKVTYHSSQPWPFPSSLMIGVIAEALNDTIIIDRNELEDCQWFSFAEVKQMLAEQHPKGMLLPKPHAIAHHLVKAVLEN